MNRAFGQDAIVISLIGVFVLFASKSLLWAIVAGLFAFYLSCIREDIRLRKEEESSPYSVED